MDEIAIIPEKSTSLTSLVALTQRETTTLHSHSRVLKDPVDDLSDQMGRNNLIFTEIYGMDNAIPGNTQAIVKDFIECHLIIALGAVKRAHRLYQKRPGAKLAIIAKFLSYRSKEETLRNASRLQSVASPRVRISEDFSPRTRLSSRGICRSLLQSTENKAFVIEASTITCMQTNGHLYFSPC